MAFEQSKTRAKRIVDNEAVFRRANELLRRRYAELGLDFDLLPFICECGNERCTETLTLTLDEYGDVRAYERRFLIIPGHELLVSEELVDEHGRFAVVEKPAGEG